MSYNKNISINIRNDAQSRKGFPYVEHTKFIKYCTANKVSVNEYMLEAYEKKGLLYPCRRLLYPRELLKRAFRARHSFRREGYKIRGEWKPLIDLEKLLETCNNFMDEGFKKAMVEGHPFEQMHINREDIYVFDPAKQPFKAWKRYKVIVGEISETKMKDNRAKLYYSSWKIFFVHELNRENTDTYNRATETRRGWGIFNARIIESKLDEFIPFFEKISLFSFRWSLYDSDYYYRNRSDTQEGWAVSAEKLKHVARFYFKDFSYKKWIHFLRKLIEIHENTREAEKILLSLEAKSYIARTVRFLRYATDYEFQKICDDVSGTLKNSRSQGSEDGVDIHQGRLEALFADEKWDLEKNVSWMLEDNLKALNKSLEEEERITESLAGQLFSELVEEPQFTALAAIRKINKAYWDQELWCENDIWSGITDLAVSIEDHGKTWIGENKRLEGIFSRSFDLRQFSNLKQSASVGLTAKTADEFIQKLKLLLQSKKIPENKRCGKHLLITLLTRNFSTHNMGGFKILSQEERSGIYIALVRTLFVVYAKHKNV